MSPPRLPWARILDRLTDFYTEGVWRVPVMRTRGVDPYTVFVSTILSHRTRDEITERATLRVLSRYSNVEELSRADSNRLKTLIDEVGLSASKAAGLVAGAKVVVTRFGGRFPTSEEELLKIPLVGPKTASAILVFGFQRPGIPVDSHIIRVARRMGAARGSTIGRVQKELKSSVPVTFWPILNPVLVQHGMNVCVTRDPQCKECPIADLCPQIGIGN